MRRGRDDYHLIVGRMPDSITFLDSIALAAELLAA